MTFGARIVKVEDAPDGGVYIYGKCTGDDLDLDDQIIDKDWARDALQKWFTDWANVRQMHSTNLPPAGKAIGLDEKEDGFYLRSHITEPTAAKLCKDGVYQAYSIGVSKPRIIRDIKARGGRVVGGIVSENSLVDFPANPTTKFMIAKRRKDGAIHEEQTSVTEPDLIKEPEAAPEQETDQDSVAKGMQFGQNPYPPSPGQPPQPFQGQGAQPAASQPTPMAPQGPNGADNPIPQADVDGDGDVDDQDAVLAAQAKPAVDPQQAAMTAATAAAAAAHAATNIHQQVANGQLGGSAPKPPAPPAAPPMHQAPPSPGNPGSPAGNAAPAAKPAPPIAQKSYKRLHDALCCAYSPKEVNKAYKIIRKGGLQAVVDPAPVQKQLTAEASQEHPDPAALQRYSSIFLAAATIKSLPIDEVEAARADLHKMFTDMYPDTAKPSPTSMSPGQFKRPYVADGRSPANAPSMDNAMPSAQSDVPSPGDFDRGSITGGRQDESPESTSASPRPAPGQTGRVYYTNAARNQAQAAIQALHDHVSAIFPMLCPMTSSADGAVGSSDASGMPRASAPFDNRADAMPQPVSPSAQPDEGPIADQWKNAVPQLTKAGMVTAETVKALIKKEVKAAKADLRKKSAVKLEKMQARIHELESMPDPARAPMRGSVQTMRSLLASQTEEVRTETSEDLQKRARDEQVEYLQRLMKSGHPELRMRAESQLQKILGGVLPTQTD